MLFVFLHSLYRGQHPDHLGNPRAHHTLLLQAETWIRDIWGEGRPVLRQCRLRNRLRPVETTGSPEKERIFYLDFGNSCKQTYMAYRTRSSRIKWFCRTRTELKRRPCQMQIVFAFNQYLHFKWVQDIFNLISDLSNFV